MRKITADWVFPVSRPPVHEGVVVMDDHGKILDLCSRNDVVQNELEHYEGLLCPGFVNAHGHLELSYLNGKIREQSGLVGFIQDFMKKRNDEAENLKQSMEDADAEMRRNGIVAAGDISNTSASFEQKARSPIQYHTFVECFGLYPERAEHYLSESRKILDEAHRHHLSVSITPHAPYSVTDELLELIFSFNQIGSRLLSFHNQETEEENKWARGEHSAFDSFYSSWNLPAIARRGKSSLQASAEKFPAGRRMLFVHNTYSSTEDLQFVINELKLDAWLCTCPGANLFIENRIPDYSHWVQFHDRICIGTDSYASNHRLSILEEMKLIQLAVPAFSLNQLLPWATLNGAAFFGWESKLGSFDAGKIPGINLITEVDVHSHRLLKASQVRPLV